MAMNFTNVIKPTHLCNLTCSYCYNEDTRAPVMPTDTLRRVVDETFHYCSTLAPYPHVDFIWHGGEPMIAGLDFFQEAVVAQRLANRGLTYDNTLQTNGTFLDDSWADFLKANRFRVSISIDGPREMHDATRQYASRRGSFDAVMKGVGHLRKSGIPFGVCVVLSKANASRAEEIYDFLAAERLPFNVIPLTRSGDGLANYGDLGLAAEEYASPWIKMFDRWYDAPKEGYVYCSDFALKTRAILTGSPQDCIGQEVCSTAHVSTDPDGNVYPCATLSADDEWRYGNLLEKSLLELMSGPVASRARERQVDPHCVSCKWRHVCHGGCMQRAVKFYGTHHTRDYYCDSLYRIYDHIEERLRKEPRLSLHALPDPEHVDRRPMPPLRQLQSREVKHVIRLKLLNDQPNLTKGEDDEQSKEKKACESRGIR